MGFSVSATMAIFFAAFLTLFSFLYASVNDAFDAVEGSLETKLDDMSDRASTSIDFVNARYYPDDNTLEVMVRNSGGTSLEANATELLIDGLLSASVTYEVNGLATDLWLPTDLLIIRLVDPNIDFRSGVDARAFANTGVRLASPTSLSVGDEVYVLDGTSIDVFTLEGAFDFTITDATHLANPSDVKVYGDYLYVLDNGTHVDRFSTEGVWTDEFVANPANTPAPGSMALDGSYMYLVDGQNHVDRYDLSTGAFVDILVPNGGTMTSPTDICAGAYLFVTDYASGAYHIDRYALDGTGGSEIITGSALSVPTDISVSAPGLDDRHLYIADGGREILVFGEDGTYQDSVEDGLSDAVRGVDATGKIYVSDGANGLVIENLGASIKVVTENGVSKVMQL